MTPAPKLPSSSASLERAVPPPAPALGVAAPAALVPTWPLRGGSGLLCRHRPGGKPFPETQTSCLPSLWSERGQMAATNPITGPVDRRRVTARPGQSRVCGPGRGCGRVSDVCPSGTTGCSIALRPSLLKERASLRREGQRGAKDRFRLSPHELCAPSTGRLPRDSVFPPVKWDHKQPGGAGEEGTGAGIWLRVGA